MRLYPVFLTVLLAFGSAAAQTPPVTNAPPRALPVSPADLADATAPAAVPNSVNVHWYGHGFVFLTSSVGIRAAIDPFNPQSVQYKFPDHLVADLVLVTHEAEDHCAASQIFGNPLIFRSVMAVGFNRANGIPFYGVPLEKDASNGGAANTAFTITFDGVRFGYLGQVNAPLTPREKELMGTVDVLFLPVGLQTISVAEMDQTAKDVGARMIIPLNYKTDQTGDMPLRTLDDYLSASKFPRRQISSNEIVVTRTSLPDKPTLYILKSP